MNSVDGPHEIRLVVTEGEGGKTNIKGFMESEKHKGKVLAAQIDDENIRFAIGALVDVLYRSYREKLGNP